MKKLKYLSLLLLSIFFISACNKIPTHKNRVQTAKDIVNSKIYQKTYSTNHFNHFTYLFLSKSCENKLTNVYIEGDGLAWITSSKISNDPTPINPMALKLFMQDDYKCKIYIARPCQYTMSKKCNHKYWTSHRFSKKVIESHNNILNIIKKEYKLNQLNLIAYSGGGAVATIIAAKRDDIEKLVTVAGNLDTNYWTNKHKITALHGSLNPADFYKKLESIKQYHLIGEKDRIIDKSIFKSYLEKFDNKENIQFKIIKDFTHNCCWDKEWKRLIDGAFNKSIQK